jgi:hypothetical protein
MVTTCPCLMDNMDVDYGVTSVASLPDTICIVTGEPEGQLRHTI